MIEALAKELRGWQALLWPSLQNNRPNRYALKISQVAARKESNAPEACNGKDESWTPT